MANPTCPANCATPLPVMSFTDCNPEVLLSEIEYLLFGKPESAPISNMASVVEWNSRISNTSVGADALRQIRVTGDMPAAQDSEVTISGQRKLVIDRTFTVNADVDESNQQNHDAFRQLQCGGEMNVRFVTRSGHVFGGADGIIASVKANIVLGRGETEIQKYQVVITWKNKFMPERHVWPLAGVTSGGTTTFDTALTFVAALIDTDQGVTGTVLAMHPTQKFEFNLITPRTGTPNSMTVNVGGAEAIVIDFPSDYAGAAFRYTHTTGAVFSGGFINGTLNF